MDKTIKVYGLSGKKCKYCVMVKDRLNELGLDYKSINLDTRTEESLEALKFIKEELKLETVPQVFIGDKRIGGYEDTVRYLNSNPLDAESFTEKFEPTPEEDMVVNPSNRQLIQKPEVQESVVKALSHIQNICHGLAVEGGWWSKKGDALKAQNILDANQDLPEEIASVLQSVSNQERNPLELIALMHSELSESLEGVRKDQMDDKLPHRKMEEVELADTIVRILDYAGGRNLDVAGALVEKLVFNITREDHQMENRMKDGGKKY